MRVYPVPPPVSALFAMPMALFQMGSASLDAISFAMCVLAAALFMRAANARRRFSNAMHCALVVCLLLLASARTNLIAVVWLPAMLYWARRTPMYLLSSGTLMVFAIAWTVFAAITVEGQGIRIQYISPARLASYYLMHLDELFSVMYSTLSSGTLLLSYWRMFVGVLGWIDTPLDWFVYWAFAVALAALAVTTAQVNPKILLSPTRVALAIAAVSSTVLLFLIFLVTFTLHPANFIGAIQGRYFYPMAIFLGFALFDWPASQCRSTIAKFIVVAMLALSSVSVVPKLIGRYWVN